jgi:hypothetical protein
LVRHITGKTIQCTRGCTIRIDSVLDEQTVLSRVTFIGNVGGKAALAESLAEYHTETPWQMLHKISKSVLEMPALSPMRRGTSR